MDINKLKLYLEKHYYKNLVKYMKKNNIDYELEDIDITETSCDKIITDTESNDYYYKKQWSKLALQHKIIKMKEFVNTLNIDTKEESEELKNKLIDLIKNKVLTKKEMVQYDEINCKITSIPLLKYKNGYYDFPKKN